MSFQTYVTFTAILPQQNMIATMAHILCIPLRHPVAKIAMQVRNYISIIVSYGTMGIAMFVPVHLKDPNVVIVALHISRYIRVGGHLRTQCYMARSCRTLRFVDIARFYANVRAWVYKCVLHFCRCEHFFKTYSRCWSNYSRCTLKGPTSVKVTGVWIQRTSISVAIQQILGYLPK